MLQQIMWLGWTWTRWVWDICFDVLPCLHETQGSRSVCRAAQPEQLTVLHTVLGGLTGTSRGPKWLSAMLSVQ